MKYDRSAYTTICVKKDTRLLLKQLGGTGDTFEGIVHKLAVKELERRDK